MLDEKFAKFEHSLRNDRVNPRNNFNSKEINKKELSQVLIMTLKMAKNSLRRNFKSKRRRSNNLIIKDNKKMFLENEQLHNEIKALYQSQEENQIEINRLAQYNRLSFMLEL